MSAWKDFVTASLLGTEKGGATPALPAALENVLGPAGETMNPEARFLTRAGALALWRRAGWKPGRIEAAVPPSSPPENLPFVHATSVAHLRVMLGGHCAEALPEWLGEAARRRRRLPPELLPALLDWTHRKPERLALAAAAGGARVRWLAAQNPAWNFAADDSPDGWETGSRDQRAAILRRWRAADPAGARTKLEAVWNDEPADVRAAFLALLAGGLSGADEPFLERALDDRGKTVQGEAVQLLSRLPESAFAARMKVRATPILTFKRGGLLSRASLKVNLPDLPDPAGRRDGLDPKLAEMNRVFGEKAGLVAQILASVPLAHWTHTFGETPAALLKAVGKDDFAGAVAIGWTQAALEQCDAAWAEALLDAPAALHAPPALVKRGALACLLPEEARAARLQEMIRRHGLGHQESWKEVETLILSFPDHLPLPLAQNLVRELRMIASVELPWHLRAAAKTLATKIPPKLLRLALDDWPERNPAADFVEMLAFRHDTLAALAQP